MADSDFTVKAIISAQTSQFERGMKDAQKSLSEVSKSIQGVSNLLKSAFSVVGIGMSIKAVVDFGNSCVKEADNANKSFSILQNTINMTGASAWTSAEKMEQMSVEISNATNYSVGEIQDMQSVLLGFRNITGDTFREASDAITDMATVMGMDLKSAVQTVGKALDDPITGLDSLRRQGFAFTKEQKNELSILVKNGNQMQAQKIILDELATTYGGAAKAGQSATAQWEHAMDSFRESIGKKLMPAVQESTELMTKMISKITDFINSSEFNKIISIFVNIANKVKEVFSVIISYVSEVFTEIMEIFKKVDFSPFKSVLDSLLGSIMKVVETVKKRIGDIIEAFKSVAGEIGNIFTGLDFEGISKYINAFIDGFWFIYDEVQKITQGIQDWITEKIIWIWEKIKELFNNSNEALANSESSIKSWGDFFWEILDNVFRIFQDLINSVKAILDGDWAVAWEYAKLAVMRVADNILDIISTIANAFPDLINGMINELNKLITEINKVRSWFGKDPLGLIESFTSVDLSEASGLTKLIEDTEKKIEELTGKTADVSIKTLKGISAESKGTFDKLKSEITSASNSSNDAIKRTRRTYSTAVAETSSELNGLFGKLKQSLMKIREKIEKDAEDWTDVMQSISNGIMAIATEISDNIADALLGNESAWENMEQVALEAIAGILKALSQQLMALSAVQIGLGNYAKGAMLVGASATALVASSVMSKLADKSKEVSDNIANATTSLEEFKNRLAEILSGADSVSELFASIKSISEIIKDLKTKILGTKVDFTFSNMGKITELSEKVKEATKSIINAVTDLNSSYIQSIDTSETVADEYFHLLDAQNYYYKLLNQSISQMSSNLGILNGSTYDNERNALIERAKLYIELAKNIQLSALSAIPSNIYEDLTTSGTKIGEALTTSIINGATKADFLTSMKDYMRENLIKLAVYTDTFNEQMAKIGVKMSQAIATGADLTPIRAELEALYETASESVKKIDESLSKAFSGIGDEVSEVSDDVSEAVDDISSELSRLEQQIESFKDTISDLGGDIASELINGLTNGLDSSDFLDSFKTYLKKLIIQSVVYTETLKSEIESIGTMIADGLSNGFSETTLHEIRRDISYLFSSANNAISGIDTLLESVFSGYATGTQSAISGLHLVGEAGPELVNFKGGERVYNNTDTMKILNGSGEKGNTFNVTFNNLQDTSAYAMMSQLRDYNRQMAINGIL